MKYLIITKIFLQLKFEEISTPLIKGFKFIPNIFKGTPKILKTILKGIGLVLSILPEAFLDSLKEIFVETPKCILKSFLELPKFVRVNLIISIGMAVSYLTYDILYISDLSDWGRIKIVMGAIICLFGFTFVAFVFNMVVFCIYYITIRNLFKWLNANRLKAIEIYNKEYK